ncbi:MAG: serine/threonine-protein kinase [Simkaniaceae bacterium]|nr:serine/threonine-protein kinase [Simkaniaceae bacterium]
MASISRRLLVPPPLNIRVKRPREDERESSPSRSKLIFGEDPEKQIEGVLGELEDIYKKTAGWNTFQENFPDILSVHDLPKQIEVCDGFYAPIRRLLYEIKADSWIKTMCSTSELGKKFFEMRESVENRLTAIELMSGHLRAVGQAFEESLVKSSITRVPVSPGFKKWIHYVSVNGIPTCHRCCGFGGWGRVNTVLVDSEEIAIKTPNDQTGRASTRAVFLHEIAMNLFALVKRIPHSSPFMGGFVPREAAQALTFFEDYHLFFKGCKGDLIDCIKPSHSILGPAPSDRMKSFLCLFSQILVFLKHLHRLGKVHGDLSLENILRDGEFIYVADLGSLSNPHETIKWGYKSSYLSPENAGIDHGNGDVLMEGARFSTESDMWAVGVMLFMALSLQMPFDEIIGTEQFFDSASIFRTWSRLYEKEHPDFIGYGVDPGSTREDPRGVCYHIFEALFQSNPVERATASQILSMEEFKPFVNEKGDIDATASS